MNLKGLIRGREDKISQLKFVDGIITKAKMMDEKLLMPLLMANWRYIGAGTQKR